MSYLLPAGTAPRTVNNWGLGRIRHKAHVREAGMALGRLRHKAHVRARGMSFLGDSTSILSPDATIVQLDDGSIIDTSTGNVYDASGNLKAIGGVTKPPSQPGVDPATQQAYKNLLTQQQNSQNPLDYVSPQAAIAAGLPSQAVYNAWSTGLAKFPTQQAALNAGIPAGVVTQLWAQSRAAVPAPSTSLFGGIDTTTLLLFGGGALLLLPLLRGRR